MRRKLTSGLQLHLTKDGDVWLNTAIQDFDGLCIGTAATDLEAIDNAIGNLLAAVTVLKKLRVTVEGRKVES